MLSVISTAALHGLDAVAVNVETDITNGLPVFHIVGLADVGVKEARERIRSAVVNSGCRMPTARIIINMSPADVRKRGTHLDLPMAMGILADTGQILAEETRGCVFIGELSLDGTIRRVNGILPMLLQMERLGFRSAVIPQGNRREAGLVRGIDLYPASHLREVIDHFNLAAPLPRIGRDERQFPNGEEPGGPDFVDVRGQEYAKRAIVIAAAGGHGLLMTGSPSTGKTMLAERIPSILPRMNYEEILEVTRIYSVAGLLDEKLPYIMVRPFRSPHHSITPAGLVGGGAVPVPGEITLADKGVLFLDEFGEFDRGTIDMLRQPLENRKIEISRLSERFVFPADFLLVAAANPCRCGYYGDEEHECRCTASEIERYRSRISGPIMDRIDLHITLRNVRYRELTGGTSITSAQMREQVERARRIQEERFRGTDVQRNGQLDSRTAEQFIWFDEEAQSRLGMLYDAYALNPRTFLKIRKVARTIADLEGAEQVRWEHIAEAVQYREEPPGRRSTVTETVSSAGEQAGKWKRRGGAEGWIE